MDDWKNGMAYALGGAAVFLVGNLLRELLEEMEQEEELAHRENVVCKDDAPEKKNSLDGIADIVRHEAEAAMAECQTDEERQAVASKIEAAITELQSILKSKGDAIAEAVKKQSEVSEMQQESADGIDHAANICRATAEVNSALDDVLAYLKQRSACHTAL